MKPIRVLVADDHTIVRQGLRALLEQEGFNVVAEAADGREAIHLTKKLQPEVAVLDLQMPLLNGIDAAAGILRECPGTTTILLTMHNDDQFVVAALKAGITGYVLKNKAAADLVEAIRKVAGGGIYFSSGVSREAVQAALARQEIPSDPLTPRERQVLQLIAEGKTTKEAAAILDISFKTADAHRANILRKLNLQGTAALVRYAIRRGMILP